MRRTIAFGTGLALTAAGAAGCNSMPEKEKQVAPEFQTSLMSGEAHNNLIIQTNAGLPVSDMIGACAVRSIPKRNESVVVVNPPFGEVSSFSGNSKEVVRDFGFIVNISKSAVGLGSLGTKYSYSGGGAPKSGTSRNFYLVTPLGQESHIKHVVPKSNVLQGTMTAPETMTLYADGTAIGTTFYLTEAPDTRQEASNLCTRVIAHQIQNSQPALTQPDNVQF